MERDARQNEFVGNYEGEETLANKADALDKQTDIVASSNFSSSSGVTPSPNVVPSKSTTFCHQKQSELILKKL